VVSKQQLDDEDHAILGCEVQRRGTIVVHHIRRTRTFIQQHCNCLDVTMPMQKTDQQLVTRRRITQGTHKHQRQPVASTPHKPWIRGSIIKVEEGFQPSGGKSGYSLGPKSPSQNNNSHQTNIIFLKHVDA